MLELSVNKRCEISGGVGRGGGRGSEKEKTTALLFRTFNVF